MRAQIERIIEKHKGTDSTKTKHAKKDLQTVETLLKNADRIDHFLENNDQRIGHSPSKKELQSNITDNESFKATHEIVSTPVNDLFIF